MARKPDIGTEAFSALDLRVGRIVAVEPFPEARKPAWKLRVDFGPGVGELQTSAQITSYPEDELVGRLVVGAINLGAKRIAGYRSEFLVLGGLGPDGTVHLLDVRGVEPGAIVASEELRVGLLLLLAACGGDGAPEAATSTTVEQPPSTTAVPTTEASAETSTTIPGPRCPSDLPAPTAGLTYGFELDGQAGDDAATVVLADDGWHLRVHLADGGSLDEALSTAPADVARIETARDLDGDGTDELFVQVGTGAAVRILGLFAVDGCDVEPILHDGSPASFAIGGTVLLLQGLACGESDLTHLGATSEDGLTYATVDLTYELQAGELVRVGDETDVRAADDPAMADYSDFAC